MRFMCGMRVSKIAQIEVQDVRLPSGAIRQEVSLRAAMTKGCRQRCIYPTNRALIEALECAPRLLHFRRQGAHPCIGGEKKYWCMALTRWRDTADIIEAAALLGVAIGRPLAYYRGIEAMVGKRPL